MYNAYLELVHEIIDEDSSREELDSSKISADESEIRKILGISMGITVNEKELETATKTLEKDIKDLVPFDRREFQ